MTPLTLVLKPKLLGLASQETRIQLSDLSSPILHHSLLPSHSPHTFTPASEMQLLECSFNPVPLYLLFLLLGLLFSHLFTKRLLRVSLNPHHSHMGSSYTPGPITWNVVQTSPPKLGLLPNRGCVPGLWDSIA